MGERNSEDKNRRTDLGDNKKRKKKEEKKG